MYTVATHRMAIAIDKPFLDVIPRVFVYVALAAWLLAFVGLMRRVLKTFTTTFFSTGAAGDGGAAGG
jgi:hypothetical protein